MDDYRKKIWEDMGLDKEERERTIQLARGGGGGVGGMTPAPLEGLLSLRSREPTKTLKARAGLPHWMAFRSNTSYKISNQDSESASVLLVICTGANYLSFLS